MRKVLRGYAKAKNGDLIQIGTIPVPHSKDKRSPSEREDKRHLIRQGATILKRKLFVSRGKVRLWARRRLTRCSKSRRPRAYIRATKHIAKNLRKVQSAMQVALIP